MSGALAAIGNLSQSPALRALASQSGVLSGLPGGLSTLLIGNVRSIQSNASGGSTIIPDVTIEETHNHRVTVTQHPVSTSTPVSDHVYRQPYSFTARYGWTNANPVGAAMGGFSSGGGFSNLSGGLSGAASGLLSSFTEQRVQQVFAQLKKLQFDDDAWGASPSRMPVNLLTVTAGKYTYPNMVITELTVRTDRATEFSLMVECRFQEIIQVSPQDTTQPAQQNQANPASTASPTDTGTKGATSSSPPSDPSKTPSQLGNWLGTY